MRQGEKMHTSLRLVTALVEIGIWYDLLIACADGVVGVDSLFFSTERAGPNTRSH